MTDYWQTAPAQIAAQQARAQALADQAAAELLRNPIYLKWVWQRDRIGAEIAKFIAQMNRYGCTGGKSGSHSGEWSVATDGEMLVYRGEGEFRLFLDPNDGGTYWGASRSIELSVTTTGTWHYSAFHCEFHPGNARHWCGVDTSPSSVKFAPWVYDGYLLDDRLFEQVMKGLVADLVMGLRANNVPLPTT